MLLNNYVKVTRKNFIKSCFTGKFNIKDVFGKKLKKIRTQFLKKIWIQKFKSWTSLVMRAQAKKLNTQENKRGNKNINLIGRWTRIKMSDSHLTKF